MIFLEKIILEKGGVHLSNVYFVNANNQSVMWNYDVIKAEISLEKCFVYSNFYMEEILKSNKQVNKYLAYEIKIPMK